MVSLITAHRLSLTLCRLNSVTGRLQMCRYGMYGPYKQHYACFDCRKAFKRHPDSDLPDHVIRERPDDAVVPCPDCNQNMHCMGFDFEAPKKSDIKQWAKVALLYRHGFAYHSCGCCGPGYRPECLKEVETFIHESTSMSEAEKLLVKYGARAT